MARGRSTRRWRTVRAQARQRDMERGAPCWICGGKIDYLARYPEPDSWVPDHYKPVSEHPELAEDINNLRPAHASCNASRGKGERPIGIGEVHRKLKL